MTAPRIALAAVAAMAACGPMSRRDGAPAAWIDDVSLTVRTPAPAAAAAAPTIADGYRVTARAIIAAARADRAAYHKLRHLTDRIGHRLAGSAELDQAIAWAAKTMRDDGHVVRLEEVMVPHWVRGAETAAMVTPVARPVRVLGLGGTVPTPRAGITAPVIVVRSWDELEARAAEVKGAIVLYDVALPRWSATEGSGYGNVVPYRGAGAIAAARHGAVGMLMRSVTARSLGTPHTGAMRYDDAVRKIPAAAITIEDSAHIARLAAAGDRVTVKLQLDSRTLPDARSANVLGELRGGVSPDEIVVIAAHLDSWDVGQGAHDDGAGVVMVMQALTTLRQLGLVPRRTIRVVLYTNEENGLRGANGYFAAHAAEVPRHVAALESDAGGFAPLGFSVDASDAAARARIAARLRDLVAVLAPVGAMSVELGHAGADIDPLIRAGVPGLGLVVDGRTYFDYHHTEADTLDKVDPEDLADNVAVVATMAYVVADLPVRLDAPAE